VPPRRMEVLPRQQPPTSPSGAGERSLGSGWSRGHRRAVRRGRSLRRRTVENAAPGSAVEEHRSAASPARATTRTRTQDDAGNAGPDSGYGLRTPVHPEFRSCRISMEADCLKRRGGTYWGEQVPPQQRRIGGNLSRCVSNQLRQDQCTPFGGAHKALEHHDFPGVSQLCETRPAPQIEAGGTVLLVRISAAPGSCKERHV